MTRSDAIPTVLFIAIAIVVGTNPPTIAKDGVNNFTPSQMSRTEGNNVHAQADDTTVVQTNSNREKSPIFSMVSGDVLLSLGRDLTLNDLTVMQTLPSEVSTSSGFFTQEMLDLSEPYLLHSGYIDREVAYGAVYRMEGNALAQK